MTKEMPTATLGRTGLRVSRLGFGCMRLPMKGEKVDRDRAIPLLHRAVEKGITYFDTAVGYCHQDSQRALGEAMVGLRDRVILSTKNPHYNKADEKTWWTNLENSLKRLRTDHIDVYNFHGLNWKHFTEDVKGPRGQIRWMLRAKEQKLIRHVCCSFHDTATVLKKLAATGLFEAVTLQYNLLDRSNEEALEYVSKKCGMGIVVMGPVGGGRLGAPSHKMQALIPGAASVAEVALRFVLANPHVTVALSGMNAQRQLDENARVAREAGPLNREEVRRVDSTLKKLRKLADLYCTGCRYCMPCPHGVNIPANFSALNLARVYGLEKAAGLSYARLKKGQAAWCVDCGACLPKCPQNIPIPRQLRATAKMLGTK